MDDRSRTLDSPPVADAGDAPRSAGHAGSRERDRRPGRRRTLGLCAHCREPVEIGEEHVRLYRLAWHLDCALASGAARFTRPDMPR